jgi:hypothetical protein
MTANNVVQEFFGREDGVVWQGEGEEGELPWSLLDIQKKIQKEFTLKYFYPFKYLNIR